MASQVWLGKSSCKSASLPIIRFLQSNVRSEKKNSAHPQKNNRQEFQGRLIMSACAVKASITARWCFSKSFIICPTSALPFSCPFEIPKFTLEKTGRDELLCIYIYTWVIDPHFFPSLLGDLLIPCVAASKGRFLSPPANKKHPPLCSTWHLPGEETLGETETLQLQSAANLSQQKRILYIDGKNVTKIGVSKTLQVFRSQGHNSLNGGYSYHPFFNAWWQQLLKGSYNQCPFFDATFMLQFSTQGTPEAPDIKVMRTMRTPRF